MNDDTAQYITLPTPDGNNITARLKHRGTKSEAEVCAEMTRQLNGAPLTPQVFLRLFGQIALAWTTAGWKVGPLGGGLFTLLCSAGGSAPIGQELTPTFEGLGIELRAHYEAAGRAQAAAAFKAEKVGEQNRVIPVFLHVYESMSKLPNHYVAGQGLTIILGNRRVNFDPANENHRVRFQKADGTWVVAAGYPHFKGSTLVCLVPPGLTGEILLELTLNINGSLRTGMYAFPLA